MTTTWTVRDVAHFLSVNERTVYRMANAGQLPGFKVSGSWRFLAVDILHWVENRKLDVKRQHVGGVIAE
mgnify:CR=1 FL=1